MSEMKIVTYNLRNQWHRDEQNGFIHRVGLMYHVIEREQPDVIAFQEVMPRQLEVLEKIFPDYMFVGQGRDADLQGEALYTAIKKSTCQFCGMDIFWLSPQPYVPATRFETQSECPRICVDVLVRHKESGKMFRIYDVHLDHIESEAKAKGMKVVGLTGAKPSKLAEIADVCIMAPSTETYMIQEYHLPIYHAMCLMVEENFFGE